MQLSAPFFGSYDKNFDISISSGSISETFPFTLLQNGITLGTSDGQRQGRKILLKRWECNLEYTIDMVGPSDAAATAVPGASLRVLLVYDKQPNGAAFGYTDLFSQLMITSLYQISNSNRFSIFYDQFKNAKHSVHYTNTQSATPGYDRDVATWCEHIDIDLSDYPTIYDSTSVLNSPSPIMSGTLYLVVLSNGQTATDPITDCYVQGNARLYYET